MLPLPAVAFELSTVLLPVQNEALPLILAVGNALKVATFVEALDVHPLLSVIVTEKLPVELTIIDWMVAQLIRIMKKLKRKILIDILKMVGLISLF